MAKKGVYLSEEVGFKAEVPVPKKTVKVKATVKSTKKVEPKIKK